MDSVFLLVICHTKPQRAGYRNARCQKRGRELSKLTVTHGARVRGPERSDPGRFLGLDNIGVFDRSALLPTGGCLERADRTTLELALMPSPNCESPVFALRRGWASVHPNESYAEAEGGPRFYFESRREVKLTRGSGGRVLRQKASGPPFCCSIGMVSAVGYCQK